MLTVLSSFVYMYNSEKTGPLIGPFFETFSIIFLLKRLKINKQKLIPIYCRVTINGQRIELSTKRRTSLKDWDKKRQRPKLKNTKLKTLNQHLEQIRHKFYVEHQKLVQTNIPFTVVDLKNGYLNKKEKAVSVIEVIDAHNIDMEKQIPESYSYGTYKNYKTLKKHLIKFIRASFKQSDISIKKVDRAFIYKLERHLLFNTMCNQNGAMKVLQRFKKIIRRSKRRGLIEHDPYEDFVFTFKRKEIEFLTQEEVDRIIEVNLEDKSELKARELFVFSLYTGLSYADVISLKWHQIHKDKDGSKFIYNQRKKTGESFIVPLLKPTIEILKYKIQTDEDSIFDYISNSFLNKLLKQIAKKARIFKNLTFHIARHTFATTITLNNDVPIVTVSKMLGHSSIKTTQIYAKVLQKKVTSDMKKIDKKLFKKIKQKIA